MISIVSIFHNKVNAFNNKKNIEQISSMETNRSNVREIQTKKEYIDEGIPAAKIKKKDVK